MQARRVNILSSLAVNNLLLLLYQVHVAQCRFISAAAGGVAFGIARSQGFTWSDASPSDAFFVLVLCSGAGGIVVFMLGYVIWQLFKKHVLKIRRPSKNFVVEKKVKCKSGKYLCEEEEIGESSTGFSSPPAFENS